MPRKPVPWVENVYMEIPASDPLFQEILYRNRKDMRWKTFYRKGLSCVECNLEANRIVIYHDNNRPYQLHMDFFCDGTMLTVDHIWPKSRGGSNHIDNLQPMCSPCNSRKKDKIPDHLRKRKKNKNE